MSLFPPELFNVPYSVRLDQVDPNTLYIGKAEPGAAEADAVWKIQLLTVAGTITSVLWADGDNEFDNAWDNRASIDYS